MAAVWLEFHFKGESFDIPIYDVDLLSMFEHLHGKESIHIYIEETKNPIRHFGMLFELRRAQREESERKQREQDERNRLERESQLVEPLTIDVPVVDVETNETNYVRVYESQELSNLNPDFSRQSPQLNETTQNPTQTSHMNEATSKPASNKQSDIPTTSNINSNPQNQTQFPQNCPTNDRFFTQQSNEYTFPNPSKKPMQSQKKIPKTTAKRKGLYVPPSSSKRKCTNTCGATGMRPRRNIPTTEYIDEEGSDEGSLDDDYNDESDSDEGNSDSDVSMDEEEAENMTGSNKEDAAVVHNPREVHPFDKTIEDCNEEDGQHYLDRSYTNGSVYVPQRWGEITLEPWLLFMSKEDFLSVFSDYCIQQGFSVVVSKSDKARYTAECSSEKCTWKIHCSMLPDKMTWAIKKIEGEHKECFFLKRNPMATTIWMVKKLESELKGQPNMPVKSMGDRLMANYGIDVSTRTLYKVRVVASELICGAHEKSYNLLPAYAEMIKKTNPGSWALTTWHSPNSDNVFHFKGMFVTFSAWVRGFLRGCRPIIGVDGCHLKGRYKGMLLSAMSLDGNNNLYCIAYAIVGKEKTETWAYFFRNLRLAFQQHGCMKWNWTFISDRMKGVEKALEKEFPQATRRICAQHLYTNFKEKWPGPLYHNLFWSAASATSPFVYNNMLDKIGRMSPAAVEYLTSVPQQWSKHQFDPEVACDHNTSNFVESFNALMNDLREKPVIELMEGIRTYYMETFAERAELSAKVEFNGPTPYALACIESNCADSRIYEAIRGGGGEYEVHEGYTKFPVNLLTGTCMCGEWQITGIPCKHACRAIYANKEEPVHYLHGYYSGQCYQLTYADHMHPLPDKDQWPTFEFPEILPPLQERGVGRPTRQRKRKAGDPKKRKGKRSSTITCSICKTSGHNARSCQGGPTAKQKKAAAAERGGNGSAGASSSQP